MALDAKMIPSMQVDFSVSIQGATVEGTAGKSRNLVHSWWEGVYGSYVAILQV
jgi:hypothetical protein